MNVTVCVSYMRDHLFTHVRGTLHVWQASLMQQSTLHVRQASLSKPVKIRLIACPQVKTHSTGNFSTNIVSATHIAVMKLHVVSLHVWQASLSKPVKVRFRTCAQVKTHSTGNFSTNIVSATHIAVMQLHFVSAVIRGYAISSILLDFFEKYVQLVPELCSCSVAYSPLLCTRKTWFPDGRHDSHLGLTLEAPNTIRVDVRRKL